MVDSEFNKKRVSIVIEALALGLEIPYKSEWSIFFRDEKLYQAYDDGKGRPIIHKSEISLSKFIEFVLALDIDKIKKIYGDSKLIILQNKLIEQNRSKDE